MNTLASEKYSRPRALILASASPRRQELLARVGIPAEVILSQVEETVAGPGEAPAQVALRNAHLKAEDVAHRAAPESLVLAADTVVEIDGADLGKPTSPDDARAMLRRLAGRIHQVHTGFVVMTAPAGNDRIAEVITTHVEFIMLSDQQIDAYIATGEPFDKAGSYGIQGIGAFLVRRIDGSYTNVVGLPLAEVVEAIGRLEGPGPLPMPLAVPRAHQDR